MTGLVLILEPIIFQNTSSQASLTTRMLQCKLKEEHAVNNQKALLLALLHLDVVCFLEPYNEILFLSSYNGRDFHFPL